MFNRFLPSLNVTHFCFFYSTLSVVSWREQHLAIVSDICIEIYEDYIHIRSNLVSTSLMHLFVCFIDIYSMKFAAFEY